MEGGIHAWNGLKAEGLPESGMAYFTEAHTTAELLSLAWKIEEGSRYFYQAVASKSSDGELKALCSQLALAEEHHKSTIEELYSKSKNSNGALDIVHDDHSEDIMEGGITVKEALQWANNKSTKEVLEFTLALEANAYDLYIKMQKKINDGDSEKIFSILIDEEKQHLNKLAELLEKKI
ncbi:MAG: ferritin family protein [Nitrospira sp.]|nr:ferritin family protein [Nitrospira sp.]